MTVCLHHSAGRFSVRVPKAAFLLLLLVSLRFSFAAPNRVAYEAGDLMRAINAGDTALVRAVLAFGIQSHCYAVSEAIGRDDTTMTAMLWSALPANYNAPCSDSTYLYQTALEQSSMTVTTYLERRFGFNPTVFRDHRGSTALHFAARNADTALLTHALRHPQPIPSCDRYGATPLLEACSALGRYRRNNQMLYLVIEQLIRAGAGVNDADSNGNTPLWWAVSRADSTAAAMLIQSGADVTRLYRDEQTALHEAVRNDDTAMIKLLLRSAAPVDIADNADETPLFCAHSARAVSLLVSHKANINHCRRDGSTALVCLLKDGRVAPALALIAHGADPLRANTSGVTALLAAVRAGWSSELDSLPVDSLLSLLAPDNAALNAYDSSGRNAIIVAALRSEPEFLDALLRRGAPANARDRCGNTPIHLAADNCDSVGLSILLAHGADVSARNHDGATPLHFAARPGGRSQSDCDRKRSYSETRPGSVIAACALLLESGAETEHADTAGNTTLHYAAAEGNFGLMRLLVARGAQVSVKNLRNETPCDVIPDHLYYEAIRELANVCADHSSRPEPRSWDSPDHVVSLRLSAILAGSNAPGARLSVVRGNDHCDEVRRRIPRVSLSYDVLSVSVLADKNLADRYGVSWYHAAADAVSLLFMFAGSSLSTESGNPYSGIGGGYLGLIISAPLWAPPLIANTSFDFGWEILKVSIGWNTDLYIWKDVLLVYQPHVSLKIAFAAVTAESGMAWTITTNDSVDSRFPPRAFFRLGIRIPRD